MNEEEPVPGSTEPPNYHNSNSGMPLKVDKCFALSDNAVAVLRWLVNRAQ